MNGIWNLGRPCLGVKMRENSGKKDSLEARIENERRTRDTMIRGECKKLIHCWCRCSETHR
eukprot:scaffold26128_cov157-Cylindrotheca_fusiformis.AAC.2